MAITDVSGLTVDEILAELPADVSRVASGSDLLTPELITVWKGEAEARAALLLKAQGASTTLSDDARAFAGEFVKKRVIGEALRKMREFTIAAEYLEDAKDLEPVLRSFAEELDQETVPGANIHTNIDTGSPTRKRWGADYSGF